MRERTYELIRLLFDIIIRADRIEASIRDLVKSILDRLLGRPSSVRLGLGLVSARGHASVGPARDEEVC